MLPTAGVAQLLAPDDETCEQLRRRFGLDPFHIKDMRNRQHPPACTRSGETLHLLLRIPADGGEIDGELDLTSLSLLCDPRLCVLVWPTESVRRFDDELFAGMAPLDCVVLIAHLLLDPLLHRVYALREIMDEAEDRALADVERADLASLLTMRREIAHLARAAQANAEALESAIELGNLYSNLRMQDALEQMRRAQTLAESKAEHALLVMQAVQSLLGQKLNRIMKFLAVVTFILSLLAVIAGIFGMNFSHMPVLQAENAFMLTLLGMALLAVVLGLIFRFKRWW